MFAFGNIIFVPVPETLPKQVAVTLPDGYSMYDVTFCETPGVNYLPGIAGLAVGMSVLPSPYDALKLPTDQHVIFPVVNGKSPNQFIIHFTSDAIYYARIVINKFGGEPDTHYFDEAFEPVIIHRKDGTEYNLIPQRDYM